MQDPASRARLYLQNQLRRLQTIELQLRILVHDVASGLKTRQRVQSFAYGFWLQLRAGFGCHLPVVAHFLQNKRLVRVTITQLVDLGGVERRPKSARTVLAEPLGGQLWTE